MRLVSFPVDSCCEYNYLKSPLKTIQEEAMEIPPGTPRCLNIQRENDQKSTQSVYLYNCT